MIIIPMAGESRRFRDAGYSIPKYMLPISGKPLFDWTLLSFKEHFASEHFLFVARDAEGTEAFLESRLSHLGIKNAKTVILSAPTAGQAETVEVGLQLAGVTDDTDITIFNIDTIRPLADVTPIPGAAGWIEVFEAPGDNWSFVQPDPNIQGRVLHCTEKDRVSDLCCTGLYNFKRTDLFFDALQKERASPTMNELFVAPLFNHLLAAGLDVAWRSATNNNVILSGIPMEYEDLKVFGLNETCFCT